MDMSLGCLGGHEIVSCMVQWTLDGKDPEVLLVVGFCVARAVFVRYDTMQNCIHYRKGLLNIDCIWFSRWTL